VSPPGGYGSRDSAPSKGTLRGGITNGLDFGYTKEEDAYKQKVAAFLDKELTEEIARQNWEDLGLDAEGRAFGKKLYEAGLLGWSWPVEYGGKGLSPVYDFILIDELGKRWSAHVPTT